MISNDEEKDELLVDEKPFEPPIPPKVIRMQQVKAFFTNCWRKPSHHLSEKYLNDLDKRLVEKERPSITILILTISTVQINGIVSIGCVEDELVNRRSYRSNSIL